MTFIQIQCFKGGTQNCPPFDPQSSVFLAKPSQYFFQKRGTPFFADRPPGLSYRRRWVESKGSDGIPRQPITLRFVGYLLFPVGRAGEAQGQSCHNAGGAKPG
jgi:hypothetical protein